MPHSPSCIGASAVVAPVTGGKSTNQCKSLWVIPPHVHMEYLEQWLNVIAAPEQAATGHQVCKWNVCISSDMPQAQGAKVRTQGTKVRVSIPASWCEMLQQHATIYIRTTTTNHIRTSTAHCRIETMQLV